MTTIELNPNFIGSALDGVVTIRANARYMGRTAQLRDAIVGIARRAERDRAL